MQIFEITEAKARRLMGIQGPQSGLMTRLFPLQESSFISLQLETSAIKQIRSVRDQMVFMVHKVNTDLKQTNIPKLKLPKTLCTKFHSLLTDKKKLTVKQQ